MTNEEILKQAIEKAINGGYETEFSLSEEIGYWLTQSEEKGGEFPLIFSHDFAKAFWDLGKAEKFDNVSEDGTVIARYCEKKCKQHDGYCPESKGHLHYNWQYHLQQMVLEKEPLKYLKKFL